MQYRYEQSNEDEIHFDEFGCPDIDYYTEKARKLRAVAMAELIHDLVSWITRGFRKAPLPSMNTALKQ